MFLNVCKRTFHISRVRISQKLVGVLMWNLKTVIFMQRRKYWGVIEKRTKSDRGREVLACVYVRFLKKNAEIFKMKFYSYSPVFPIDMAVWNIKQTIMKDYISVLSMNGVRSLSAALYNLRNFSFFSLHCPLFSLRIFSKDGYQFIGYR